MYVPVRTEQTWGHRTVPRAPLARDTRPVPVCTLAWNDDGCTEWSGTLEKPAQLGNHVRREGLEEGGMKELKQ